VRLKTGKIPVTKREFPPVSALFGEVFLGIKTIKAMNPNVTISLIVVIVLIAAILYLIRNSLSGFLKDWNPATKTAGSYSLSRTLLCLWTLLTLFAMRYIGLAKQSLPDFKDTGILVLLGIVAGTSVSSRVIDQGQPVNPKSLRSVSLIKTSGFLTDILSDANGISVSRFQTLCFNLIYASLFISQVISDSTIYHFDNTALTLLGVSSGAYAAMKIPESQPKA
jgi:hypothetical protein